MGVKKNRDWFGYLVNFVAVCLGIAITFAGQGIINRNAERNEVKRSLILVKNELQDNISYIEYSDSVLTLFAEASRFLIEYEGCYDQAPVDSMAAYCNVPLTVYEISHADDALELLKTSSLFTKIKDQNLSLEIIHTYGAIADEMAVVNFYHERRGKYLEDALNGKVKDILANDGITAVQLWNAITSSKEGKQYLRELCRLQMEHSSYEVKNTINNTIALIDRYIQ